jgi:hypothetical protein
VDLVEEHLKRKQRRRNRREGRHNLTTQKNKRSNLPLKELLLFEKWKQWQEHWMALMIQITIFRKLEVKILNLVKK